MPLVVPRPTVTPVAEHRVKVEIGELVLPYALTEFELWAGRDRSNQQFRDSWLNLLAKDQAIIMNKKRSAFHNQASGHHRAHFPEVKCAIFLQDNFGYKGDEIFYENWVLSNAISFQAGTLKELGTRHVEKALGYKFLSLMRQLIDGNGPRPHHKDQVDLFAFSRRLNRCSILEVKRDSEIASSHQLRLLALVAYLWVSHRDKLDVHRSLVLDIGIVRFVQKGPFDRRSHEVCIDVPTQLV
jgi:hypothetical protein